VKRFIILRIDDIFRILADYSGEALGLPDDAQPSKFRIHQGKLQLYVEADSWDKEQPAEEVKFDMKRIWAA
jgi:hypothetical protein